MIILNVKGDEVMHETSVYVRFCETDAFGHTNNTSYFYYFEESRMKFFHEVMQLEDATEVGMVVARLTCDYIHQTYANDTLIARTSVEKLGTKSLTLRQEVLRNTDREIVATGQCTLVCFDNKTQSSIAIPDIVRERLQAHLIQPQT